MSNDPRSIESFDRAARALESAFFLEQDRVLIGRLRALREMAETREALAEASGITDDALLRRLVELGIRPQTLAALAAVPLVEVAWADGAISSGERRAVLAHANARGIRPGTIEHELLERWLEHRPEPVLFEAWREHVRSLCGALAPEEKTALRQELLHATRATAEASGGILGLGSISRPEQAMLDALDGSFCR